MISALRAHKLLVIPILLFLIFLPAIWQLLKPGFFSMYDDMQVIRLYEMHKCVTDFQIPCRWVPDLGLGYGYPLFIYYAPLPYYLMEIFHLLGFSLIDSVKVGFSLSVFLSALFFYKFARYHFSEKVSLLLAFIYTFIPFRAGSIYVRGAMGEAWGLAMVPLVFWALELYLSKKDISSKIILSLSFAGLLITHNLTVLIFSPLILLWGIVRIRQQKINIKDISSYVLFLFLGLGLSSFFTIPLLFERNLVHLETLTSGYFGYLQHFLSLSQIFWFNKWGYGPSILGPGDDAFLGIGPLHTFVAIAGFVSYLVRKKNKRKPGLALLMLLAFLVSSFLAHPKSTFIWNIAKLDILQFPWRFISVSMFASTFLAGYIFNAIPKKSFWPLTMIFCVILALFYFPFFKPKDWFQTTDQEKLSGENLKKQLTASIYDYLPKSASKAPDEIAPAEFIPLYATNLENFELKKVQKGSDWINYDIDMKGRDFTIAVPVYDFPNWVIKVNGQNTDYKRYGTLGLPSFTLVGDGSKSIEIRLKKTWDRVLGDAATIGSFLILCSFLAYEKIFRKNFQK